MCILQQVQWNLQIKNTLHGNRHFDLRVFKCISTIGKLILGDMIGVPCREVVPFSEGPLSEVPLYSNYIQVVHNIDCKFTWKVQSLSCQLRARPLSVSVR